MLEIKNYKTGILKTNCYLIKDTARNIGIVIDPGGKNDKLEEEISQCPEERNRLCLLPSYRHQKKCIFRHI